MARPVRSPAHEAGIGILRTADLLRRHLSTVVEPHGVTLQQFNVLRILRGAGDSGLPTLEVAARMIEQTPGVTRLLDRMEAKGLVRRQRCPHDRRQHLCWITPDALRLLERLDAPFSKAHDTVLRGLDPADRPAFIRQLEAIQAAYPADGSST
jgi:DNA-binding MarR family transcriptional regulator